eukprot:CAMPEP_0181170512 /NCGR_PEP_ID=MMETSP1096-20121128/1404_1 /TAXON_ID=156174 ORGANISM="Chrysochromulina ericina, Strain CCMP281" /NCGR_SAMPLE_ID=MMETSP1096 /ASSEMBLY_ACC=CAM_ASM_000453 /LENGTH=39 /DNA_ID= /DNA_START= /DNA_END= /DNA_ORIENTATION=
MGAGIGGTHSPGKRATRVVLAHSPEMIAPLLISASQGVT